MRAGLGMAGGTQTARPMTGADGSSRACARRPESNVLRPDLARGRPRPSRWGRSGRAANSSAPSRPGSPGRAMRVTGTAQATWGEAADPWRRANDVARYDGIPMGRLADVLAAATSLGLVERARQ